MTTWVNKIANYGLILPHIYILFVRVLWNGGNFWLFILACLCIFSELGMALAAGLVKVGCWLICWL